MHRRRLALLQPPLAELNEKAYAQLVRQTLFDISTIACEALEIKALAGLGIGDPYGRDL